MFLTTAMVSFPFGYGSPLMRSQTLIDVAPQAALKMAEGDAKGLIRLVESMGVPSTLRVPAIFQLGIGYGISHRSPLPEGDFLRLIRRLFDQQFPSLGPEQKEVEVGRLLSGAGQAQLTSSGPAWKGVSP